MVFTLPALYQTTTAWRKVFERNVGREELLVNAGIVTLYLVGITHEGRA